jgi:capsular polysaccharide transport system permease protein
MSANNPTQLIVRPVEPLSGRLRPLEQPSLLSRLLAAARKRLQLMILVVIPALLLAAYLFLIAADLYEAEARFVVRSASGSGSGMGTLASMMPATTAFSRATDDTYSVNTYMTSRDAVDRLVRDDRFLERLAVPEADFWQRFPRPFERATRERLVERIGNYISVSFDSTAGISTLRVKAFRPDDARDLAIALTRHSEELINRMNTRARADSIEFASKVVEKAEQRVTRAYEGIAKFRADELVFDPGKQSTAAFELMNTLVAEVTQLKAALAEAKATAPNSPNIPSLQLRIKAFEKQIDEQRLLIAGGSGSLAGKLAQYETLTLERELSAKSLTSALLSLENARQESQRQQLYLELVVAPSLPDQARYPKRLMTLLVFLGIAICVHAMLTWLTAVVMEHDP